MGRQALAKQTEHLQRFQKSQGPGSDLQDLASTSEPEFGAYASPHPPQESFPPLQAQFRRQESRTGVTCSIRWAILCPFLPRKNNLK